MEALSYVDTLVKEYLLFRGFTRSLQAINAELAGDKGCGFQAEQISNMLFQRLLPQQETQALMELLGFLKAHVFSKLSPDLEASVTKLEVSVLRSYLVHAFEAGKLDEVQSFFSQHGEALMTGPEAAAWGPWFALPYLQRPQADLRFQVFFTKSWRQMVEASFRNFVAEAVQQLPLPALLRFNTDRKQRQALQRRVEALTNEVNRLRAQAKQRMPLRNVSADLDTSLAPSRASGRAAAREASWDLSDMVDADYLAKPSSNVREGAYQEVLAELATGSGHQQVVGSRADNTVKNRGGSSERSSVLSETADSALGMRGGAQAARPSHSRGMSFQDWGNVLQAEPPDLHHPATSTALLNDISDDEPVLSVPIDQTTPSTSLSSTEQGNVQAKGALGTGALITHLGRPEEDSASHRRSSGNGISTVQASAAQFRDDSTSSSSSVGLAASARTLSPRSDSMHAIGNTARPAAMAQPLQQVSEGGDLASISGQQEQLEGHQAAVSTLIFAPGGRNLASASRDGVVRIWAPASLDGDTERAAVLLCGAPVRTLAWDTRADKVMLVGTEGKGTKAWHVDTKRMVAHMRPDPLHPNVTDIACSPTDPVFLCASSTAGKADRTGKLSLWNLRAFKKVQALQIAGDPLISSVCYAPDGRAIAVACADGQVRLFDANTNAPTAAFATGQPKGASAVRFIGPDGASLLTLSPDGILRAWDFAMLRSPTWQLDASRFCSGHSGDYMHHFASAADGIAVALTSDSGTVPVAGLFTAGPAWAAAARHRARVTAVAWHPQQDVVVSSAADHSLSLTHLSRRPS